MECILWEDVLVNFNICIIHTHILKILFFRAELENLSSAGHSPDPHNSQGWAELRQEPGPPSGSPTLVAEAQRLG